jgi:glycosyltransferase involved in cell wall biosynthesis
MRQGMRQGMRQMEARVYHPDLKMSWIRPAFRAALDECRHSRSDVVWATGAPWSAFLVAERISRSIGIPYVLDFRSSWTLVPNEFESLRPGWAQRRDSRTLARLFAGARSVVFFYRTEAESYCRRYRDALDPSKIHVIPNGFDGEISRSPLPSRDACRVLYAGVLASYRYDTLLEALERFRDREPERAANLEFHFVGEGTDQLGREASDRGLSGLVRTSPPMSHSQVLGLQEESHGLLMLGREPSYKGYQLLAGAKLYGYMKSGRPILGILPDDEARKTLRGLNAAAVAPVESVPGIVKLLVTVVDAWRSGTLGTLLPDPERCNAYSAKAQTDDLVLALNGRPPVQPFTPGETHLPERLTRDLDLPLWRPGRERIPAQ